MQVNDPLVAYLKKTSFDLPFPTNTNLLTRPFDRTVSRLRYKGCDSFQYQLESESITDLLRLPPSRMTFDECCFERAKELLKLDREKYYLAYSGGIDSTTALSAILQTWPEADLKRITIIMGLHSCHENPSFFERYILRFPIISAMQEWSSLLLGTDHLLITGELGDQLFGSDVLMDACSVLGDKVIHQDYREVMPRILDIFCKFGRSESRARKMLELFEPVVAEAPFPIRSAHDFTWWFNFTQKWQVVKFRFFQPAIWDTRVDYGKNILHFFDTAGFQQWSLENHDLKIGATWDSYKFTAKNFIYRFTGDSSQLRLLKKQSLFNTYFFDEHRIALTASRRDIRDLEELAIYAQPQE